MRCCAIEKFSLDSDEVGGIRVMKPLDTWALKLPNTRIFADECIEKVLSILRFSRAKTPRPCRRTLDVFDTEDENQEQRIQIEVLKSGLGNQENVPRETILHCRNWYGYHG